MQETWTASARAKAAIQAAAAAISMRQGVRGDAAHRVLCGQCREVSDRYGTRRRHVGLSPAEARIVEAAWARLTDREVFASKARALLMGEIPRPRA